MAHPVRPFSLVLILLGISILTSAREIDPPKALAWSIGPVLVRPKVEVSQSYDDNILFLQTNSVDDFISRAGAGVGLLFGTPQTSSIGLTYGMDSWFYAENSEFNHTDHQVTLRLNLQWPKTRLTGMDFFQSAAGIYGQDISNRLQQGVVSRASVSRDYYHDEYRLTHEIAAKTSLYLEGTRTEFDFEEDSSLIDYNTLRAAAGAEFKALPKTSFFGEIYYGQTAVHPNTGPTRTGPHLTFLGTFIGARGDFTPELTGSLKVGYETSSYSDHSPAPDGPVVLASLAKHFSEKTALLISYSRAHEVSIQAFGQSVTADTASALFSQKLGRHGKWTLSVGTSAGFYEYENGGSRAQKDILIAGNLGLTYQVQQWLSTYLRYEFQRFDSNLGTEYQVNRVTLGVTLGY